VLFQHLFRTTEGVPADSNAYANSNSMCYRRRILLQQHPVLLQYLFGTAEEVRPRTNADPDTRDPDTTDSDTTDSDTTDSDTTDSDTTDSDTTDSDTTDSDTGRLSLHSGQRAPRRQPRDAPKRGQWGEGLDCGGVGHGSTEG
jgi:hypothetical protein